MDTVTKINAWDYIDLTRINASTLTEILLQSGYVITGIDNVSFSHFNTSGDAVFNMESWDDINGEQADGPVFVRILPNGDFSADF
jgi:hypothetical protein